TLYDDWIVTAYNIVLTSAPPFFLAVFEKDITEDIIEKYPQSYQEVQAGKIFTYGNVIQWLISAFYHSIVLFGVGFFIYYGTNNVLPGGEVADIWHMGQLISTIAILVLLDLNQSALSRYKFHNLPFGVIGYFFLPQLLASRLWTDTNLPINHNFFTFQDEYRYSLTNRFVVIYDSSVRRTWKPLKWQILQEQKIEEDKIVDLPEITPREED
ncbi:hypothetical protein HMI54_011060, partial [Coelomomyces lativittatus]